METTMKKNSEVIFDEFKEAVKPLQAFLKKYYGNMHSEATVNKDHAEVRLIYLNTSLESEKIYE